MLFETKNQELPGLIFSVDFEKAFDTVSWEFIENVVKYFNFLAHRLFRGLSYFKADPNRV